MQPPSLFIPSGPHLLGGTLHLPRHVKPLSVPAVSGLIPSLRKFISEAPRGSRLPTPANSGYRGSFFPGPICKLGTRYMPVFLSQFLGRLRSTAHGHFCVRGSGHTLSSGYFCASFLFELYSSCKLIQYRKRNSESSKSICRHCRVSNLSPHGRSVRGFTLRRGLGF